MSAADRLDAVLYGLAEGLRVTTLLLHAYMPETTGRLLEALEEPARELADFGSRGGGQSSGELAPLFPKLARRVADRPRPESPVVGWPANRKSNREGVDEQDVSHRGRHCRWRSR